MDHLGQTREESEPQEENHQEKQIKGQIQLIVVQLVCPEHFWQI